MDTQAQTPPPAQQCGGNIVTMEHVRFAWPGREPFSMSIESFCLPRAKRVLLVGPSGSGKSTFLSLLCGIVAADAGRIEVLGQDLTKLPGGARDQFRAEHFGIIFQMFNLLPYGSVRDNVMLPLRFAPARRARACERARQSRKPRASWQRSASPRPVSPESRRPASASASSSVSPPRARSLAGLSLSLRTSRHPRSIPPARQRFWICCLRRPRARVRPF